MTVDQRGSRRDIDRVENLLSTVNTPRLTRPFERTAGDEVQAVAEASPEGAETLVDIALALACQGTWSIGIGIGIVEQPLPKSTRAGRGPAFEAARDAVTRAKNATAAVAITSAIPELDVRCTDAETALALVALLITDRTEHGHQAADLMNAGHTQTAAAELLGISKQAMSQRLSVARWSIEANGRQLVRNLLADLGAAAAAAAAAATATQPAITEAAGTGPEK